MSETVTEYYKSKIMRGIELSATISDDNMGFICCANQLNGNKSMIKPVVIED